MSIQKSWIVTGRGNLNKMVQTEQALNPLKPGKIRIKTKAIGLNFADIFAILGLYSAAPKVPFSPGLEYSGTIEEINAETHFKVGESVMGITRFNGYSTHIDIEPVYCSPLPKGWSYEEGGAFLVQTLTAWYALKHLGNVKKGQHVLISSAAGGVGLQAMKICKAIGAEPIGTVSTEEKKTFLQNLGFENVIKRTENFKNDLELISQSTPINLALDAIGGKTQKEIYRYLAPMGRLVVFGSADFTPVKNRINIFKSLYKYINRPKYDPLKMIEFNKSILGFNLIWLWENIDLLDVLLEELSSLSINPPYVGKTFLFNNAIDAVRFLKNGNSIGKVILKI